MFQDYKHVHFIGIGGSGMSGLAWFALENGVVVSGSDSNPSLTTVALKEAGATVIIGHKETNIPKETELVIYTEAVDRKNNPEYLEAMKRRLMMKTYFEALGDISREKRTIVVAGTHGKTTTTAMLGQILATSGRASLVIVGSTVPVWGRNIFTAPVKDGYFVVEACEYRRSFLNFSSFGMVLLNCEFDHPDYYKDEADYMKAFTELAEKVSKDGFVVYNADDKNAVQVAEACKGKKIPVTMAETEKLSLNLKVPGRFNILNAGHAFATTKALGGDENAAIKALEDFRGTGRRMEIKGEKNGILVIDDYGHHPTEIRATLGALREKYADRRIICVYQPHQYARTLAILDELPGAFSDADKVIIPNIYAARDNEEDMKKISAEKLVELIAEKHPDAVWGEDFERTLELLEKECREGDVVVFMGAGDINVLAERFCRD